MSTSDSMRKRLKLNRPSLRRFARPPKQRTAVGAEFTAANLPVALAMQHCRACAVVQYPPREVCGECLEPDLVWRETPGSGTVLAAVDLHHSLWEFFKRRMTEKPWPIATVKLDCGVTVFAHLAVSTLDASCAQDIASGTPVQVFSHSDASRSAVLIAVSEQTAIHTRAHRTAIAESLGLTTAAEKPGGI